MIQAAPGATIVARVNDFPPNLDTVAYTVINADQVTVINRTLGGVAEAPAGSGSYTVEFEIEHAGVYEIVWDFGATVTASEQIVVEAATAGDLPYAPSVDEVAGLLPMRTFHDAAPQMTFNTVTTPTGDQAQTIIDAAASELEGVFGPTVPAELASDARQTVKFRAASLIELAFFADQVQTGRSSYTQLDQQYKDALAAFILRRRQLGADEVAGTPDDQSGAGLPAYSTGISFGSPIAPGAQEPCDGWGGVRW